MAVILRNNGSQQHLERINKRTLNQFIFGTMNLEIRTLKRTRSFYILNFERLHVESELSQHKTVGRGTFQKLVTKRKRAWQTGQNKTKQNETKKRKWDWALFCCQSSQTVFVPPAAEKEFLGRMSWKSENTENSRRLAEVEVMLIEPLGRVG